MLTMRTAAALLAASRTLDGLADALRSARVVTHVSELAAAERHALGLDHVDEARLADVAPGVRAILLRPAAALDGTPREFVQRAASRLSSRAPHVQWIIGAVAPDGSTLVAAITPGPGGPRVASFAWEPDHVVDSDAETLCALAAIRREDDALFHSRCAEVLGRDALTRRFYRELEAQVAFLAHCVPGAPDDARTVALLYASRLLFLCFVQAKGWLDMDRAFLASRFDACMRGGGEFHRRVLLPLFFGTLNTPATRRASVARAFGRIPFLNGGLFTRTPTERRVGRCFFPDDRIGELLERVFQRYRFVAREDSATWSEASVDPEMLGRAFESLMSSHERKSAGVFYTPHHLVARVGNEALDALMERLHGPRRDALRQVRVLDPACGSGAFLVFVLERLSDEWRRAGDDRPVADIRRDVLASSVFGVDRDPTAVWLCELRLWLSVVIESEERDPARVSPLPNLDRNVRVGDALLGTAFTGDAWIIPGNRALAALRRRYVRATGARKQTLARALDKEERRRVLAHTDRQIVAAQHARKEQLVALRSRDLFGHRSPDGDARRDSRRLRDTIRALRTERRRVADGGALPFSFPAFFAEPQGAGGFDIVLGNPPWVRLHRIPQGLRARFRETYQVFRSAPWMHGAGARASAGFASQVDLAALFAERALSLVRPEGVVSLLLPVKLWRSLAGGGLRRLALTRADLLRLEDLSESRHAFDAAVYPSLFVARAGAPEGNSLIVAVHGRDAYREWTIRREHLVLDDSPGAPWLLLRPDARAAFQRIRASGATLESVVGPPKLGVKSGCNAAFLVRVEHTTSDVASVVDADGQRGKVELELLRPALRGEAVTRWSRVSCDEWIVWTHDERGPLPRLPDRARAWLRRRYSDLSARTDAARSRRWWSLFRVEAADARLPRVAWADFGRQPRALVLPAHDPAVPLNTCYVLHCADDCDAWATAAWLNSPLAAAWLNAVAEPARGGYRRYLGWTVGQLPMPGDWPRARTLLAAAGRAAASDAAFDGQRLLEATLDAFGIARSRVAALLET